MFVRTGRHAGQDRHGFALAARRDQDDFIIRIVSDIIDIELHFSRDLEIPECFGQLDGDLDTSSVEDNLLLPRPCNIDDLLNTGDVGRKERHNDPALAPFGYPCQGGADDLGRNGIPLLFDVGGIRQQRQGPLLAVHGKTVHIGGHTIAVAVADLEITGMDDRPQRGFDGQPDTVHHAVTDANEFELKLPQLDPPPRLNFMKSGRLGQPELLQLVSHHAQGEGGAEYRCIHDAQQEGQGANVVFVRMGQNDGRDLVAIGSDIAHVRDDEIHPQHVILGEHETAVHNE